MTMTVIYMTNMWHLSHICHISVIIVILHYSFFTKLKIRKKIERLKIKEQKIKET